jgi:Arc/MetJ-type ribon-helix-helix transcriptional regulator
MPDEAVEKIDKMVDQGVFKNRSDAIKSMIEYYQEREKTMNFLKMIVDRSKEAGEKPEILISIDDV